MIGKRHRVEFKKAGLSGLFHRTAIAAAFLTALSPAAVAEPLAIEVVDAQPAFDQRIKQPVISIKMTPASAKLFAELTTKNLGRVLELRIDGKTVMSPVVREPILQGSVQISGGLTLQETKDVAGRIAAGKSKIEVEPAKE